MLLFELYVLHTLFRMMFVEKDNKSGNFHDNILSVCSGNTDRLKDAVCFATFSICYLHLIT